MPPDKDKKKKKKKEDEPSEKYVPENAASSAFTGPSFMGGLAGPQELMGEGGGGGGDQTARLQALSDLWGQQMATQQAMQIRPREAYEAEARARNPVYFAQQQRDAALANPFGPEGYFADRRANPNAGTVSQGNNAVNQWAQARAGAPQVSPSQLSRNTNAAAESYRNAPSPEAMQAYNKALQAKATAAREMQGAPSNRDTRAQQSTGAISATQAFGNAPYMNPELQWGNQEQVNKVAQAFDPNKFTPEEIAEFERLASATTPKTYV